MINLRPYKKIKNLEGRLEIFRASNACLSETLNAKRERIRYLQRTLDSALERLEMAESGAPRSDHE